jgi:hypothetical protein
MNRKHSNDAFTAAERLVVLFSGQAMPIENSPPILETIDKERNTFYQYQIVQVVQASPSVPDYCGRER